MYGAFAGGLAKGYLAGDENRRQNEEQKRRAAISDREMAIREGADKRAQTEHGWKEQDRQTNDAYYTDVERVMSGLKREDGAPFDPIRNPDDGVRWTQAQGDIMALGFKHKKAKPEDIEKYTKFRSGLRNEQYADMWQRFTASGFADVSVIAPLAEEKGMDPASLSVKPTKTEDGFGVQYMLTGKKKDGSDAPPVPLSIIASAYSKEAAGAIDRAEDNVRQGQVASATIAERRSANAANNAVREAAIEQRQAARDDRVTRDFNTTFNDIRKDVMKPAGKDPVTGNAVEDGPYNAYAARRVDEIAREKTGGKTDETAVRTLSSSRGEITAQVKKEITDIERKASQVAKQIWADRNGRDKAAAKRAEEFWKKAGSPSTERRLAQILRDDKLSGAE